MKIDPQSKLEQWGLAPLEAQVYLALLRNAEAAGASTIATIAGIPRPSVYPVLRSLADKNLIENGQGYGSQFAVLPPDEALPRLIAAQKEDLLERERLTGELIEELRPVEKPSASPIKLIELLRDPRVCAERFQKLQRETQREVAVFVKAPLIIKNINRKGNPDEKQSLRRGVKHRALYERTLLEDQYVAPFLENWISAGEEARVYNGELPLKLVLFDSKIVWTTLETSAKHHPAVSVLIRHQSLAEALRLLFDYFWKQSEPITFDRKPPQKRKPGRSTRSSK